MTLRGMEEGNGFNGAGNVRSPAYTNSCDFLGFKLLAKGQDNRGFRRGKYK